MIMRSGRRSVHLLANESSTPTKESPSDAVEGAYDTNVYHSANCEKRKRPDDGDDADNEDCALTMEVEVRRFLK